MAFTFGASFRRPVWHNVTLVGTFAALFLKVTVVLLTGPNAFTAVFHIASYQYNHADTNSAVWRRYQVTRLVPPTAVL